MKAGAVIAVVAVAVYFGLGMLEKSVKESTLSFVTADEGELEITVVASGRVVPAHEEIVNSPVSTRILEVYAQPGDSVRAGMPLLALDLEEEQTNLSKMEDRLRISRQESRQHELTSRTSLSELAMQIEVKQMEVNRLKLDVADERKLDSLGSGTGERVRKAETAYTAGVLELQQMRERLANERLRSQAAQTVQDLTVSSIEKDLDIMRRTLQRGRIPAPHDGILTFIQSEIGTQVGAGEKVAVVSDLSSFKIQGEVAEGASDRIGIGASVTVRLGTASLRGTVSNITPQSKGGLVQFGVSLDEPAHPRLRSGLRTELFVDYGFKDHVVRIPRGSYFKGPGDYELFVVDRENPQRLCRRTVRLGDSNRDFVEVVSGLSPADRVVVSDMEHYRTKRSLKMK